MTTEQNAPDLTPALVGCLEGLLASDGIPEGLMRGEIGWLDTGIEAPRPTPANAGRPGNRREALALAGAARNLLEVMLNAGQIGADSALQLRRALDDATARIGGVMRKEQADRIRGLYVIIDPGLI